MATTTTPTSLSIPTTETTPLSGLPTSTGLSSTSSTFNSDSFTTSDPGTSATPSPTGGTANGVSNDGNLFGNSANYFFGFLITFVVLLAVFLGCGCISRRRMIARRQAGLPAGMWGRLDRAPPPVEPTYSEPWLAPKMETKWENWRSIMPLSAAIVSDKPANDEERGIPPPSPIPIPPPASPAPPHYVSLLSISSWIPRLRRRRRRDEEAPNQPSNGKAPADLGKAVEATEPEKPPMIQVTTMIAMPCNAGNADCSSSRQVYEFGLTQVPYAVGKIPPTVESSTTPTTTSDSSPSPSTPGPS